MKYLLIAFSLVLGLLAIKELNENKIEVQISDYLIKDQGYKAVEIKSIKGMIEKFGFIAVVVFKDEPYIRYNFGVRDGKVYPVGYSFNKKSPANSSPKHWVEN